MDDTLAEKHAYVVAIKTGPMLEQGSHCEPPVPSHVVHETLHRRTEQRFALNMVEA